MDSVCHFLRIVGVLLFERAAIASAQYGSDLDDVRRLPERKCGGIVVGDVYDTIYISFSQPGRSAVLDIGDVAVAP